MMGEINDREKVYWVCRYSIMPAKLHGALSVYILFLSDSSMDSFNYIQDLSKIPGIFRKLNKLVAVGETNKQSNTLIL